MTRGGRSSTTTAKALALVATTAAACMLAFPQVAQAQFHEECGVGETQLYIHLGGTDKLTKCSDYFDEVDPYTSVTVGEDRLGISRMSKRLDNDPEPQFDQTLSFGCVEKDSKIAFRVRDQDYFGDESCIGPIGILGRWPASGKAMVLCETPAAVATTGMPGTGCISFTLYYGDNIPTSISQPTNQEVTITPSVTPSTLPADAPSKPGTPDSPLPTVTKRPATNATAPPTTSTNPSESTDPRVPPKPRNSGQDPTTTPATTNPTGGVRRPSNVTKPSVMQAPAPEETQDKNKERPGGRHNKGAAVAGGILATLALVGIGAGILASRRRLRNETHNANLDVEEEGGGRRGAGDDTTPGSIAVL